MPDCTPGSIEEYCLAVVDLGFFESTENCINEVNVECGSDPITPDENCDYQYFQEFCENNFSFDTGAEYRTCENTRLTECLRDSIYNAETCSINYTDGCLAAGFNDTPSSLDTCVIENYGECLVKEYEVGYGASGVECFAGNYTGQCVAIY